MRRQRQGGFLIAKVHLLAGRIFERMLRRNGLDINPAQGRILFPLWQDGPMSMQELARKASLGPSTLTSMLDRLESAGYVTRGRSARDRRKIIVKLVATHQEIFEVWGRVSQEMAGLFYRGFAAGDIDRLEGDLRRILDNLLEAERDSKPP